MTTVTLAWGDFVASVESDQPPYPDMLDDLARRCVRIFVDAHALLPEGEPDAEAG